jgi:type IV pilus assembly protein PilV
MNTRMTKTFTSPSRVKGVSLLEVMVAMVIFSVGLLGLAGLQATSLSYNKNALSRTIAIQQAENMADRIRANTVGALNGNYDGITTAIPSEPTTAYGTCYSITGCSDAEMTNIDVYEWNTRNSQVLPSGRGTVTGTVLSASERRFTITVMCDEAGTGVTGEGCSGNPTVDLECFTIVIEI